MDTQQTAAPQTDNDKPLTNWKNEPSVRELKQDLMDAQPSHSTQVSKVEEWLDNLNVSGKAIPNVPKGSSKVVPRLIRKQAEWRYAALSEPFLSTRDLFKVSPVTWEDKQSAVQNELVLNNQFNTKIDKVKFIDEFVRTAVDEGTAIIRTGWEFEEETFTDTVPEVTFTAAPELQPLYEELDRMKSAEPGRYEAEVPEELKMGHELYLEQGIPVQPNVSGYKEEQKTRTIRNHPTAEVCDTRNTIIDPSCKGDLDKAGFVIHRFESSLSQLKKDGKYKNLDSINIDNNSILGEPDHATENTSNFNFTDTPRKKFVVYEYWGYWDINGDGSITPIVAAWVGDTLIRMEENPFPDKKVPFVSVQYLPVRRSTYGEPDGHLIEDNQKIVGAVTRGMIDIMGKSANGQMGHRKDALDVTNRRRFERGEDYEYNAHIDPRLAFHMHTYPEIPQSAQYMLSYQNLDAESLSGVKAFTGGISGEGLGKTATGVRSALDAASKRELGILRRLASGIAKVGHKFISMNSEFLDEDEVVRVTNEEFVHVRRDDLGGHFDLVLSISTAEEDNAKAEELAFMLQTTGPQGDPNEVRMIRAEIARLRKMPDLAKRIEEYEPQPDPIAEEKRQLENELLKAQIAAEYAKTGKQQSASQLDQAKAQESIAKAADIQGAADLKNLDFVEQESGVKQERDLEKHGEQARSNMALKAMDHQFKREESVRDYLREYLNKS